MGKYAFCFEHRIFAGDDDNKTIKEYFIPYRPNILINVVKNRILKQRLELAGRLERTFDDFVEEHNLQNEDYIASIPENGNLEKSWWINDEMSIDELSLWDYLADVKTVADAVRFGRELPEQVNYTAEVTMISRLKFEHLKLIISILIYTDGPDFDRLNYIDEPPLDLGPDTREQLIQIYRALKYPKYEDLDVLRNLVQKYIDWSKDVGDIGINSRAYTLIKEIEVILEGMTNTNGMGNYYYYISRLKDMRNKFVKSLGEQYERRYKYIKKCVSLITENGLVVSEIANVDFSDEGILEMCLYEERMDTTIPHILKNLVKYQIQEQSLINDTGSNFSNFGNLASSFNNDMKNILGGEVGKKILNKYMSDEKGCFAILITKSNKKYFSLSGREEVNPDSNIKNQMKALAKYIMENVLNVGMDIIDVYSQIYNYNWSALNGNAIRYTEILDDGFEQPEKYISSPEILSNDFNLSNKLNKYDLQKIGHTYGCCERKMLGYLGSDSVREIYSRWAPCWRCRPAVLASMPCEFFAFAKNFEDWELQNRSMQLKAYIVTQKIEYDVE